MNRREAVLHGKDIEHILARGFAIPDQQAREELLQRCLDELNDESASEIDDSELDLLAAAGDVFSAKGNDSKSVSERGDLPFA